MLTESLKRHRPVRLAMRLLDCRSGLALTEFAFSLPILLVLIMAGLETANYAMAHLRVSSIAVLTADSAARQRTAIDEAHVIEIFTGAKLSGANLNFAQNGRIVLSDVEPAPNGTNQWIRWQRCDGLLNVVPTYGRPLTAGGTAIANGTEIYRADRTTAAQNPSSPDASALLAVGRAGRTIAAQPGTAVMFVEVSYRYQSITPFDLLDGRIIRYENSFNVRDRTNQSILNAGRVTPRSCNTFQA